MRTLYSPNNEAKDEARKTDELEGESHGERLYLITPDWSMMLPMTPKIRLARNTFALLAKVISGGLDS